MAALADVVPRARRVTIESSDDSDPDIEKAGDDSSKPLLAQHSGKAHASPAPKGSKPAGVAAFPSAAAVAAAEQAQAAGRLDWLKSLVAIVVWYSSNIGLLLLNKYLLGFGFRRPVFLTLWHMIVCCLMTSLLSAARLVPVQHITSARQFGKVAVLALIFCLSVVLGNVSLKHIPVSFSQAIGATTPLFTAGLAFCMLRQRETARVYLALIPVVAGIVVATGAEPSFQLLGFLAAVGATAARAFKSILQACLGMRPLLPAPPLNKGLLLTDTSEQLDSMNLLRHMTPIASIALLVLVATLEPDVGSSLPSLNDEHCLRFYAILGANGALAFLVNLTNFLVTRYTSALTLQVLGNGKGVIAVVVSIAVFGNPWTLSSMGGYSIAVAGVALYMHEKRKAKAAASSPGVRP